MSQDGRRRILHESFIKRRRHGAAAARPDCRSWCQMRTPLVDFQLVKGIHSSRPGAIRLVSFAWLVCCSCIANAPIAKPAEPIKIGAVLPFSGGVELYGRQAKLGLDLAVKEINARSGILGRPVEVIYEDDKTNPAAAVGATHKLIERDGVLAVVGSITSQNLDAI